MAAIENALLDVKAKALGIPVYALFGGPVRDRLPLYWSHCGSYRFRNADVIGIPPVRSLDDLVTLGKHVKERGFKALQDQHLPLRPRSAQHAPARLRPRSRLSRTQPGRRSTGGDLRRACRVPRGRRPRHGNPARFELQLQNRGLHQGRAGLRALQSLLAGDQFLRPRRPAPDPRSRADADRLLRIAVRPPPVPAVLREPLDRRVDHRRAVERR